MLTEAADEVLAVELEDTALLLPAAEDDPLDEVDAALELEPEPEPAALLGPLSPAPRSKRPGERILISLFRLP